MNTSSLCKSAITSVFSFIAPNIINDIFNILTLIVLLLPFINLYFNVLQSTTADLAVPIVKHLELIVKDQYFLHILMILRFLFLVLEYEFHLNFLRRDAFWIIIQEDLCILSVPKLGCVQLRL